VIVEKIKNEKGFTFKTAKKRDIGNYNYFISRYKPT
jgi:hypothetical protein